MKVKSVPTGIEGIHEKLIFLDSPQIDVFAAGEEKEIFTLSFIFLILILSLMVYQCYK